MIDSCGIVYCSLVNCATQTLDPSWNVLSKCSQTSCHTCHGRFPRMPCASRARQHRADAGRSCHPSGPRCEPAPSTTDPGYLQIQTQHWDTTLITAIGTTRPIPPNQRLCLGCIRRKDMSNPKRLRWNIVLMETYESCSAITKDRKQCAIGTTRPIPPNRRLCQVAFYT